jgi:hypothetical protein
VTPQYCPGGASWAEAAVAIAAAVITSVAPETSVVVVEACAVGADDVAAVVADV